VPLPGAGPDRPALRNVAATSAGGPRASGAAGCLWPSGFGCGRLPLELPGSAPRLGAAWLAGAGGHKGTTPTGRALALRMTLRGPFNNPAMCTRGHKGRWLSGSEPASSEGRWLERAGLQVDGLGQRPHTGAFSSRHPSKFGIIIDHCDHILILVCCLSSASHHPSQA
jgi:hypothetical protein